MIFAFWSRAYVRHLEEEIAWLRLESQKAQQRYEVATDQLVILRTGGQASVAPRPLMADKEEGIQKELASLMADTEFAQAGT